MVDLMMDFDILNKTKNSIEDSTNEKVELLEKETKNLQESNPYKINDNLSENGFVATYTGLYRKYKSTFKDGTKVDYYLKIERDNGNKFKINYAWCIKEDNEFNVISEIFSQSKTIFEDKPQRNKMLGKYTEDYNLPRHEKGVASYLDETWKFIIDATDVLELFKDKDVEYNVDKYSTNNILQEYVVLSDAIIDCNCEFRLLYAKGESYTLFMHNVDNGDDLIVGNFSWDESPHDLSQLDDYDDKILLLYEKLQSINPSFDNIKIKNGLINSIVKLEKDVNAKMELLSNASKFIKETLVDVIATLRTKHFDNLTEKIKSMFSEHKSPSKQMLVDYINASDEFFIVHDIKKRFKRTPHGFVEITTKDISNFFNNEFGFNKVSMKRCNECLDFITRELTIDYDVIQFKNGLYDTSKDVFMKDKFASEYIPKLNLTGFCYIEDAKDEFFATDLYKEVHAILETDREQWQDWNEKIFFKSVGSCYSGVNVADKMFVIVGKSWSRKSTLLAIIKRIFGDSYCNKKIQEIVKNERFVLVPTVNKAILIDDDASDLQLNNIGNLNSFISGTGLYVEFKNANDGVLLNENNTPKIWCASNELFNVVGSGFKRRLCLILCDNVFSRDESTKQYMIDINNGLRDDELSLMISYCLQLFASEKDCAFLNQEQEDAMFEEFEYKSYAERKFVQEVFAYGDEIGEYLEQYLDGELSDEFKDDFDDAIGETKSIRNLDIKRWWIQYQHDNENNDPTVINIPTILSIKDASTICRKFFRYQKKKGTIFESQAIPSSKRIKTALEMFGYNQTSKNIIINGNRSSKRVYENIVIKQKWIKILELDKLVANIIENDL